MIHSTILRLHDMCATSIVYRLWTCQDINDNWGEDNQWQLLENKVTSDVNNLPFPESVKSHLLSLVKPSGRHFFGFLHIWLQKMATSEKWLTKGLLCDCLILYPVGIINQRETAQKLLKSKILDNVIAFRLACINFLEKEVLRLWPCVYSYILNKIVLEHQKIHLSDDDDTLMMRNHRKVHNMHGYGYVQETNEVLFWIGYCLSKEQGTSINAVPHYTQGSAIWYNEVAYWASNTGNTSFFDYAKKTSNTRLHYNHAYNTKKHCLGSNNSLIPFFYHFSRLMAYQKLELFRKFPLKCMLYFLQWPLSLLFLDHLNHHQEIFNALFELNLLDCLLVLILEILNRVRYLGCNLIYRFGPTTSPESKFDVFCVDHLEQIWVALWKLCPNETKSRIMDSFVFTHKFNCFLERASVEINFDVSNLKKDLRELYRLRGDAILKFLEVKNLADALERIISDLMPERKLDFRSLQLPLFSNEPEYGLETVDERFPIPIYRIVGLQLPITVDCIITVNSPIMKINLRETRIKVTQKFTKYIQQFLFSNNTNAFL